MGKFLTHIAQDASFFQMSVGNLEMVHKLCSILVLVCSVPLICYVEFTYIKIHTFCFVQVCTLSILTVAAVKMLLKYIATDKPVKAVS